MVPLLQKRLSPFLLISIFFFFFFFFVFSDETETTNSRILHRRPPAVPSNKHFLLVHGACHGAWSWYKVAALLKSAGHYVTALDMAASGIDPRPANSLSSLSEYFQPLMELLAGLDPDEKVVLVGHSFAGLGVSMAMESFPAKISVAVFVAASMPGPDFNLSAMAEKEGNASLGTDIRYFYDDGADKPPTALVYGPLTLESTLYSLSPPEDVTLATALVRPHRLWSIEEMNKEVKLTSKRYGSVRRVFMVTEKDLVSSVEHQQWMIQRNPPDGVIQITGSDHMAMASKPSDLAHQLQLIANNYTHLMFSSPKTSFQ